MNKCLHSRIITALITALIPVALLTQCTTQRPQREETVEQQEQTTPQPVASPAATTQQPSAVRKKLTSAALVWKGEPGVEGFIIKYGTSRENLSSTVKVLSKQALVSSNEEGNTYRYLIKNISPTEPLFVALIAFTGSLESPLSAIIEVPVTTP
jgi:hypothetical protein